MIIPPLRFSFYSLNAVGHEILKDILLGCTSGEFTVFRQGRIKPSSRRTKFQGLDSNHKLSDVSAYCAISFLVREKMSIRLVESPLLNGPSFAPANGNNQTVCPALNVNLHPVCSAHRLSLAISRALPPRSSHRASFSSRVNAS